MMRIIINAEPRSIAPTTSRQILDLARAAISLEKPGFRATNIGVGAIFFARNPVFDTGAISQSIEQLAVQNQGYFYLPLSRTIVYPREQRMCLLRRAECGFKLRILLYLINPQSPV